MAVENGHSDICTVLLQYIGNKWKMGKQVSLLFIAGHNWCADACAVLLKNNAIVNEKCVSGG